MKKPHMGEPWGYITGEGGQAFTGGHEPGPDQAYTESGGKGRGPFSSVTLETSAGSGVQNFLQELGLLIVTSKASWPLQTGQGPASACTFLFSFWPFSLVCGLGPQKTCTKGWPS